MKVLARFGRVVVAAGSGSPEGVESAAPGSWYSDTVTGDVYSKDTGTGNTGWVIAVPAGGATRIAGDLGGTPAAPTVVQLTGSGNSVAIPAATSLDWASSGPSLSDSSGDLKAKLAAGKFFRLFDATNEFLNVNWNGGFPTIGTGSGSNGIYLQTLGASQFLVLNTAGASGVLYLDTDVLTMRDHGSGNTRGNWSTSGLRVGDATASGEKLDVNGRVLMTQKAPPSTPTAAGILYVADGSGGTTAGQLRYKGPGGTDSLVAPP